MLDTNACIRYLNGRSPKLRARFDSTDPTQICVSSIVKAELFFGAAMARDPVKTLANQRVYLSRFVSIAFDDVAAEAYGEIRAELKRGGNMIGPNDLLIAAICRAQNLTLVTHSVSAFSRVSASRTDV